MGTTTTKYQGVDMDLAGAFDEVVHIGNRASDVTAGLKALVHYLDTIGGARLDLAAEDVERDVEVVREQLLEVVRSEPPPATLKTIYFGLFDAVDDEGVEHLGYYVAGADRFDPDDPDFLVDPVWFPESRHIASASLAVIKRAEVEAARRGDDEQAGLLAYAGQLGTALLVSRFASADVFPGLHRVVGFDSGDFAQIE